MNSQPLQVLLCQCLFPEAKAALGRHPVPGLEIACLPRPCAPRQAELEALMDEAAGRGNRAGGALLVGGGCLSAHRCLAKPPGLQLACRPTCFNFFAPPEQVDALLARGAYLVTPGWLTGWPKVIAEWGLDRVRAREFFAEACRSIVLLDTGVDDKALANLKDFAGFVGLPYETISVGLAHLREALLEEAWIAREAQRSRLAEDLKQARRRLAEQSALVDLVQRLSTTIDEEAILKEILLVVQSLFAPAQMLWIPHWKGQWGDPVWDPPGPPLADLESELRGCSAGILPRTTGDGILLRLEGPDGTIGLLGMAQMAFPNQIPSYLETARTLLEAAQLALGNARNLHGMIKICAWCKRVKDETEGWGTFEDYIQEQSTATFSHGMCPDCAANVKSQAESLRSKRTSSKAQARPVSAQRESGLTDKG